MFIVKGIYDSSQKSPLFETKEQAIAEADKLIKGDYFAAIVGEVVVARKAVTPEVVIEDIDINSIPHAECDCNE